MLRDVNVSIKDGGLGLNANSQIAHFKVGVSTATPNEVVTITNAMDVDTIKSKLGVSPLANAVMDSIMTGASLIYCMPVVGATKGTVEAITLTGTGEATYTTEGDPNNSYKVIIEIITPGALNVATYKYSLDDGLSWSNEKTVPLDGAVDLIGTGIKVKYTAAATPENSFQSGDTYTFSTTAPRMSNQEILDALDKIKTSMLAFEMIHIVGGSTSTLWATLATKSEELFKNYHKPLMFVLEAEEKAEATTLDQYVSDLVTQRNAVDSFRIEVCTARALVNTLEGTVKERNAAGLVCGLYAAAKVSQSIGEVASFNLKNYVTKLLPEGIMDGDYIETLDKAKFLTLRQYYGLDGFFVTNARVFASDKSDYQYAEFVRTANKACREVRIAALEHMHMLVNPVTPEVSLESFKAMVTIPLERMIKNKELAAGEVIIPEGQDILESEKIELQIKFVPYGIAREFDVEIAMSKPF